MSAPPESTAERAAERAAIAVRELSREPRPAGSEGEARARAYCAARLRAAGFHVSEEPFEYSAFVGRWGTPIGGLIAVTIVLSAAAAARSGSPGVAIVLLTLGAIALGAAARALARTGVLTFPAQRRRGVNVVAVRRDDPPRTAVPTVWLVAHLDSKSQPIPILARAAGITLVGATWLAAIGVASVQLVGGADAANAWVWVLLAVVAAIGAIPVISTTIGERSPGAVDNASGVATILAAAEDSPGSHFGVCLTTAEELGLVGARAWVRNAARGQPGVAINCDGVDDAGATTCMYSGRRPDTLVRAVLEASARAGTAVRAHRLLPGVLTDGVALADAGWQAVTLSRGRLRTLARIHTPRDRADDLTGSGVAEVARVIVEMLDTRP